MLLKCFNTPLEVFFELQRNEYLFIEKDCQASETFNEHTLNEMLRNN